MNYQELIAKNDELEMYKELVKKLGYVSSNDSDQESNEE